MIALTVTVSATGTTEAAGDDAIIPLSIYMVGDTGFDPETDPSILEFERRLGIDLEVINGPWGEDASKLNLMMASREYPDIMHINYGGASPWVQWIDEDLLLQLDPYVTRAEQPYIYSVINSQTFKSLAQNGEHYVIPGTHHGGDWNFHIRQDWLDNVGMDMPETPEELYDVLVAFRDDDPDGNGVDDTVGWVGGGGASADLEPWSPAFRAFNGATTPGDMDVDANGKVVPLVVGDGTLEALKFMNRLYRENLINTDFINYVDSTDARNLWLYSNKGGAAWLSAGSVFPDQVARIGVPEAEFNSPDPAIVAPGHKLNGGGLAWWLLLAISSSTDYPEKAIETIEYANSREGRELFVMGIEGRHWSNFQNGLYDLDLDAWSEDYDVSAVGKSWPRWWGWFTTTHGYIPAADYDTFEEAMAHVEIWANRVDNEAGGTFRQAVGESVVYTVPNVFDVVQITEAQDLIPTLNDIIKPAFLSIMIAEDPADIDGMWNAYVDEMYANGFDEFIDIYQNYYDTNLK
jgi:putative aldouronate transport system substrate-binding protein